MKPLLGVRLCEWHTHTHPSIGCSQQLSFELGHTKSAIQRCILTGQLQLTLVGCHCESIEADKPAEIHFHYA